MMFVILAAALLAAHPIDLAAGPLPVERAFELKTQMGEDGFARAVDTAVHRLQERTETTDRCATPNETAAVAQLQLVRRTPDPAALARAQVAAEAALAERETLRARYLDGEPAPPPYGLVARFAALANAQTDPRLKQLYRRMADDQFAHLDSFALRPFFGPQARTNWEKGLDEASLAYVNARVESEWCPLKLSNTAWLKSDLQSHGWYAISAYGADADQAAWLIVQHARHDLAFQAKVLATLEPLWLTGETKPSNFAMLYDQTAHYQGRPGRFGIMGECTAPGVWTPAPQEDPAATDAWRAKAGLPAMDQYVATRSRGCTG